MFFELIYIAVAIIIMWFLMLCSTNMLDACDTLIGGCLVFSAIFVIMCLYSYCFTPEVLISERKVEVLSHYETPRGATIHYLNSNGRAESIDFTDAESYMKYKNGLLLHEQEFAKFTTFGPDTDRLGYVLK
jgi:hypothetical protein